MSGARLYDNEEDERLEIVEYVKEKGFQIGNPHKHTLDQRKCDFHIASTDRDPLKTSVQLSATKAKEKNSCESNNIAEQTLSETTQHDINANKSHQLWRIAIKRHQQKIIHDMTISVKDPRGHTILVSKGLNTYDDSNFMNSIRDVIDRIGTEIYRKLHDRFQLSNGRGFLDAEKNNFRLLSTFKVELSKHLRYDKIKQEALNDIKSTRKEVKSAEIRLFPAPNLINTNRGKMLALARFQSKRNSTSEPAKRSEKEMSIESRMKLVETYNFGSCVSFWSKPKAEGEELLRQILKNMQFIPIFKSHDLSHQAQIAMRSSQVILSTDSGIPVKNDTVEGLYIVISGTVELRYVDSDNNLVIEERSCKKHPSYFGKHEGKLNKRGHYRKVRRVGGCLQSRTEQDELREQDHEIDFETCKLQSVVPREAACCAFFTDAFITNEILKAGLRSSSFIPSAMAVSPGKKTVSPQSKLKSSSKLLRKTLVANSLRTKKEPFSTHSMKTLAGSVHQRLIMKGKNSEYTSVLSKMKLAKKTRIRADAELSYELAISQNLDAAEKYHTEFIRIAGQQAEKSKADLDCEENDSQLSTRRRSSAWQRAKARKKTLRLPEKSTITFFPKFSNIHLKNQQSLQYTDSEWLPNESIQMEPLAPELPKIRSYALNSLCRIDKALLSLASLLTIIRKKPPPEVETSTPKALYGVNHQSGEASVLLFIDKQKKLASEQANTSFFVFDWEPNINGNGTASSIDENPSIDDETFSEEGNGMMTQANGTQNDASETNQQRIIPESDIVQTDDSRGRKSKVNGISSLMGRNSSSIIGPASQPAEPLPNNSNSTPQVQRGGVNVTGSLQNLTQYSLKVTPDLEQISEETEKHLQALLESGNGRHRGMERNDKNKRRSSQRNRLLGKLGSMTEHSEGTSGRGEQFGAEEENEDSDDPSSTINSILDTKNKAGAALSPRFSPRALGYSKRRKNKAEPSLDSDRQRRFTTRLSSGSRSRSETRGMAIGGNNSMKNPDNGNDENNENNVGVEQHTEQQQHQNYSDKQKLRVIMRKIGDGDDDTRFGGVRNTSRMLRENSDESPVPFRLSVQRRMEGVMEALKMSTKARLALVLKYTDPQHSHDLPLALSLWERAATSIHNRERVLASIHRFEMLASDPRRFFKTISTDRLKEQKKRRELLKKLRAETRICRELIIDLKEVYKDNPTYENEDYLDRMEKDYTKMLFKLEHERLGEYLKTHSETLKKSALENGGYNPYIHTQTHFMSSSSDFAPPNSVTGKSSVQNIPTQIHATITKRGPFRTLYSKVKERNRLAEESYGSISPMVPQRPSSSNALNSNRRALLGPSSRPKTSSGRMNSLVNRPTTELKTRYCSPNEDTKYERGRKMQHEPPPTLVCKFMPSRPRSSNAHIPFLSTKVEEIRPSDGRVPRSSPTKKGKPAEFYPLEEIRDVLAKQLGKGKNDELAGIDG